MGLVFSISFSIPLPPPREAKYCIAIFAVSVFPAPLSPLYKKISCVKKTFQNAQRFKALDKFYRGKNIGGKNAQRVNIDTLVSSISALIFT